MVDTSKMPNTTRVFLSFIIGIIAAIIAKYVHPDWTQDKLFIFGFVVFGVTAMLAIIIKQHK